MVLVLAIGLFFNACRDLDDEESKKVKSPIEDEEEEDKQKQESQPLKKAKKLVAGNFTFELNDNSASKDAKKTVWVYQGASIALTIENGQRTNSTPGTNKKLDFSKANFKWAYRKRYAQEWINLAGNSQTGRVSIPKDARVGAYELLASAQIEHETADNSQSPYPFVVRKKGCLPPSTHNAPTNSAELTAALASTPIDAIDTSLMKSFNKIGEIVGVGARNDFNQPGIDCWDTSNVSHMDSAFRRNTLFNQPIGDWDTSKVISMQNMFEGATAFNQPIGQWDVSKVTSMNNLFHKAAEFNQPIGQWNTAEVTSMQSVFREAAKFNQPIGNWDTSKVVSMDFMFNGAALFNQNLSGWKVGKVEYHRDFDTGADTSWTKARQPDFNP